MHWHIIVCTYLFKVKIFYFFFYVWYSLSEKILFILNGNFLRWKLLLFGQLIHHNQDIEKILKFIYSQLNIVLKAFFTIARIYNVRIFCVPSQSTTISLSDFDLLWLLSLLNYKRTNNWDEAYTTFIKRAP